MYPNDVTAGARHASHVKVRYLAAFLGMACLMQAQIGYPGGGYPRLPGQSPYPGGPTIPGTGRTPRTGGSKGTGTSSPNQPLPSFRGKLKHMDAKALTLELDDFRVLEFRITSKTKYFKGTEEVKSPQFNPGDQLSVEAPYDAAGDLTAVNVYWEKAAGEANSSTEKKDDGAVDTWRDKDKDREAATEVAPPPAAADPDDPGPPKLKRGKPVQRASSSEPQS